MHQSNFDPMLFCETGKVRIQVSHKTLSQVWIKNTRIKFCSIGALLMISRKSKNKETMT